MSIICCQDPKILHPVPLRVTPDSQSLPACLAEEEALRSPRRLADPTENVVSEQTSPKRAGAPPSLEPGDIRPIQRPQPKKPTGKLPTNNSLSKNCVFNKIKAKMLISCVSAPGRGAIPPPPHSSILNAPDDMQG